MQNHQNLPLLRQASLRLGLALLIALFLIGAIGWGFYAVTENKSVENESQAIFGFYENKLKEWESQWEREALHTKSRVEFARFLEDPQTRWSNLYSYLTVQGEQQAFQNVLVSDAEDRVLFRFGADGERLPAVFPHKGPTGWFFEAGTNKLFRVYHQDIWLGPQGKGRLVLLKQIDNALLYQNAHSHTDLFLVWNGKVVAGSLGDAATVTHLGDGSYRQDGTSYQQRSLKWRASEIEQPNLLVRHNFFGLFQTWQLALGGLVAALALLGASWFTLGLWLIRVSQRISALGKASQEFSTDYRHSEEIHRHLSNADGGANDEIDKVAGSLKQLTEVVLQRDQERMDKEEALAESEARIREITESLADGVFVVAPDGKITFVNPQAAQLLGYRQEELLGLDSHSTLHHTRPDGSHMPIAECAVHQAILHGDPFRNQEDFFLRKDGSHINVSIAATPIKRHGKITGSVVSFQDISEHIAAERAIRESEERFRLLFNSGSDAIFVLDGGEKPGCFIEVNDIACQRLGYTREELLGMTPLDIDDPALSPSDFENVRKELEEHWHALFERIHIARDGRRIPVEISAHLFTLNGQSTILAVARDISERKLAEAAIRASEERLALATRASGIGVWDWNIPRNELIWDDAMFLIYGAPRGQFGGCYETWQNGLHPDDARRSETEIQAALRGEQAFDTEFRVIRPDGEIRHVKAVAQVFRDEQGNPIRMVGINQDITERKRAEAEYRTLLQTTPDGFWLASTHDGLLIDVNAAYCTMAGYTREELLTMRVTDLEATHDQEQIARNIKTLLQGIPLRFETRHRRKDGSEFDAEISAQYLEARGGVILAFIRDITLRKQDEKRIAELLDFNSKIIAESTQGMLVYRASGECVMANEAAAQIVGATAEKLLQQNFRQIASWKTSGMADDAESVLASGKTLHREFRIISTFGKEAWLDCDFSTISSGGEPHLLVLISDVSAFRKAEQVLVEARQVAERANTAKSEFLANMSHEIRTPMNAIIGLSDLALGLELPPKLHDYCTKIHTSSKALLSIINDILDYSKVEAGRLELDSVEFSLEEMLENVANLFIVRAEEKGLELLFQIALEVPETLIGDPLRLGQVMNNLVGNAVKFTESGQIHIQVERVAAAPGQTTLRFAVRDSGIGMTPEQANRLFQAFTQADGSITRKYGGTGLGLTISKRLVEKMGGDITVSSEPGKGSTFTFTLTFEVPQHARLTRSPTDLRGMHVLVVDDLDISRRILSELLTQWGFKVSEAANGKEALTLLENSDSASDQVELVLLDWKMPEMDGIEVARRVRQLAVKHDIPRLPVIIMVTAYSKDKLLEEAQDVQLDAVLTKPVTASGLFDTIIRFQGGQVLEKAEEVLPDLRDRLAAIRGAQVLLVEDNEINQQVAQEFLERSGIQVRIAANGEEALHLLDKEPFDAVLMDLQMPVMDGLEATRRIRAQARFCDLPIIAMTAAVLTQDREACLAAGMNDHVAKPILPNELREALIKHIAKPNNLPKRVYVPASKADNTLPEQLPGFDFRNALALLDGNQALLIKLLSQFATQFADAAGETATLIRENHPETAADYIHKIKGAAANLGIVVVQQSAAALENQLVTGQATRDTEAGFAQALAQALAGIATLTEPHKDPLEPTSEECDKCEWQKADLLAKQLHNLLVGNDFVPHELLTEFKDAVGCQYFRSKIELLQRQVDAFDYPQALATLTNLVCSRGHKLNQ